MGSGCQCKNRFLAAARVYENSAKDAQKGNTAAGKANPPQVSLRGQHNHAAGVDICLKKSKSNQSLANSQAR
jgi:hypothetical protein